MKISPIGVNHQLKNYGYPNRVTGQSVNFQGKYSGAKWGAIIFGTAATIGAIGGSLMMTGGISAIPILAAYIGIGAGSGAVIGHTVDKGAKEFDKKA